MAVAVVGLHQPSDDGNNSRALRGYCYASLVVPIEPTAEDRTMEVQHNAAQHGQHPRVPSSAKVPQPVSSPPLSLCVAVTAIHPLNSLLSFTNPPTHLATNPSETPLPDSVPFP